MARLPLSDTDPDSSAQAFEELRGEVSLTRRAVEGLTAARERLPDYSETLGAMSEALSAALTRLERIERSPAIRLSPEAMAGELAKGSAAARLDDARLIHEARDALSRSIGRVDGIVERGQAANHQLRQRTLCAVFGGLIGMLIWAVLPGAVARALPPSWHVPEWMAARTMGRTTAEIVKPMPSLRKLRSPD